MPAPVEERASSFYGPAVLDSPGHLVHLESIYSSEGAAAVDTQAAGREEAVRFAAGTVMREGDLVSRDACIDEGRTIGGAQVDMRFARNGIALDNLIEGKTCLL